MFRFWAEKPVFRRQVVSLGLFVLLGHLRYFGVVHLDWFFFVLPYSMFRCAVFAKMLLIWSKYKIEPVVHLWPRSAIHVEIQNSLQWFWNLLHDKFIDRVAMPNWELKSQLWSESSDDCDSPDPTDCEEKVRSHRFRHRQEIARQSSPWLRSPNIWIMRMNCVVTIKYSTYRCCGVGHEESIVRRPY